MALRTLGKVAVTTAGTIVPITTSRTNVLAKAIQIQVIPANTGKIYIGLSTMVKATGVGVIAVLPQPSDATKGPFTSQSFGDPTNPAKLSLLDLYLDSDVNGEGVYISYVDER